MTTRPTTESSPRRQATDPRAIRSTNGTITVGGVDHEFGTYRVIFTEDTIPQAFNVTTGRKCPSFYAEYRRVVLDAAKVPVDLEDITERIIANMEDNHRHMLALALEASDRFLVEGTVEAEEAWENAERHAAAAEFQLNELRASLKPEPL